jgi:uncharacterized coiled-coil protein SlyX
MTDADTSPLADAGTTAVADAAPAGAMQGAQGARRTWLWLAAVGGLLLVVSALGLYAFVLNVDLSEAQRRLAREVETRERAEKYLAETRAQLTEKTREIEQLQAQLDYAAQDFNTLASQKPGLPVVVSFRPSYLGQGMVAEIQNTSPRFLTAVLVARNPTLSTVRRFNLELPPEATVAFGHLEGWRFASGDELTLYHDSFAAARVVVP